MAVTATTAAVVTRSTSFPSCAIRKHVSTYSKSKSKVISWSEAVTITLGEASHVSTLIFVKIGGGDLSYCFEWWFRVITFSLILIVWMVVAI